MKYEDVMFPTPQELEGKFANGKALIICTGPSTEGLLQYKSKIRSKFDVVLGTNLSIKDFEEVMDYHLVTEKDPILIYGHMFAKGYRKDLPRILNWKTLHKFPQDIPIYKCWREPFGGNHDIMKFSKNGKEGLLVGPIGRQGLSIGTVTLQSIHFACILGCKEIYLAGADLSFGEFDHYYKDRLYSNLDEFKKAFAAKKEIQAYINDINRVTVTVDGKPRETLEFFRDSAQFIDKIIENDCKPRGINVYDFSNGIITKANKVSLDTFFK